MSKKHNFGAGPCVLPQSVFKKASEAVLNLDGVGLSILEISHRSKEFVAMMEAAQQKVKSIAGIGDEYEVLFLQGGASLQFVMAPMNLASYGQKTAYIDTGSWSAAAIKEAKKLTEVEVLATSKPDNYNYIPKNFEVPSDAAYLHITSNNTIFGTEYHEYPQVNIPLISDMSSDIFSRPIDFNQFGLIYGGAQKNLGPAGVALVIIKKDLLGKSGRDIPSYLDYGIHAAKESMFNTPPVFSVYTMLLVLEWLEELGGLKAIAKINKEKADMLYHEIDTNPMFRGVAKKEDRSLMNATFVLEDESKKDEFDAIWKQNGIIGLNGHRSVGGYRASMYNALAIESVDILVKSMKKINN